MVQCGPTTTGTSLGSSMRAWSTMSRMESIARGQPKSSLAMSKRGSADSGSRRTDAGTRTQAWAAMVNADAVATDQTKSLRGSRASRAAYSGSARSAGATQCGSATRLHRESARSPVSGTTNAASKRCVTASSPVSTDRRPASSFQPGSGGDLAPRGSRRPARSRRDVGDLTEEERADRVAQRQARVDLRVDEAMMKHREAGARLVRRDRRGDQRAGHQARPRPHRPRVRARRAARVA